MKTKIDAAKRSFNDARKRLNDTVEAIEALADDATPEDRTAAQEAFDSAEAELEARKVEVERLSRLAKALADNPPLEVDDAKPTAVARGALREDPIYSPDRPVSFFRDLVEAKQGNAVAADRLVRHQKVVMESRDTDTSDAAGFIPPIYLPALYAEFPREGRPFADALPKIPLPPEGMTLSIPQITTGTTVAAQVGQEAAVSKTDAVVGTLTVHVETFAGEQDVSLQLLERSQPGIDQIIFGDLLSDYDTKLDTALISGLGHTTYFTHLGIRGVSSVNTVTYTDGSPTAAETIPPIYNALSQVESNRHKKADLIVAHPRRLAWLASNLSQTHSVFQQGQMVVAAGMQNQGFATTLAGLNIVSDANVGTLYGAGTNQDEIYVVYSQDLKLAEGPVRTRVLSDVLSGTLQVRLQLFAYSAFASERQPKAITVISGTGLTAPSFT